MHEISVVKPLISIVQKYAADNNVKRVKRVFLEIGEMHDFQVEWIEKYFYKYIAGTPIEGAEIVVDKIPIVYQCQDCGEVLIFDHLSFAGADIKCAKCGSANEKLLSGKEFAIKGIEVEE